VFLSRAEQQTTKKPASLCDHLNNKKLFPFPRGVWFPVSRGFLVVFFPSSICFAGCTHTERGASLLFFFLQRERNSRLAASSLRYYSALVVRRPGRESLPGLVFFALGVRRGRPCGFSLLRSSGGRLLGYLQREGFSSYWVGRLLDISHLRKLF